MHEYQPAMSTEIPAPPTGEPAPPPPRPRPRRISERTLLRDLEREQLDRLAREPRGR